MQEQQIYRELKINSEFLYGKTESSQGNLEKLPKLTQCGNQPEKKLTN
jgi:hypothetical protein